MTDNPYSTPTADTRTANDSSADDAIPLTMLAKPVFVAWERLRLIYILVLGIFTLLLLVPGILNEGAQLLTLQRVTMIVEGAIVANICFFAGPIIETYVRWLGYDRPWVRWFLFVGGTALTAILALVSLATVLIPNPV